MVEGRKVLKLPEEVEASQLFGSLDKNIKQVEKATETSIIERDGSLVIIGKDQELASVMVRELMAILQKGDTLDSQKVNYIIQLAMEGTSYSKSKFDDNLICFSTKGRPIKPKTLGQKQYVDTIRKKDVVFGIGPAGTGKTYLAVAMAVTALKKKEVSRIILARPAVEAGERLGFLPGDLQDKVDPYLRPLYDALYDVLGQESTAKYREREVIEVVPLAYMRGRTLDDAFIILDEAQNATREQMKMFLTRMGFGSKVVVTGDVTQIDLPSGKKSGLREAEKILRDVEDIGFCHLKERDVVRHQLVKKIIKAYDDYAGSKK